MRKNLALLFILVLAGFYSADIFAVGKNENKKENAKTVHVISGTVVDKFSGEPLVGAEVKIEGMNKSTFTDFDGNFSFQDITDEEVKIKAALISYKPGTDNIALTNTENKVVIEMSKL